MNEVFSSQCRVIRVSLRKGDFWAKDKVVVIGGVLPDRRDVVDAKVIGVVCYICRSLANVACAACGE